MNKFISKNLIWITLISFLFALLLTRLVWGWTNPTANPPSGAGALYYSGGNVGIGTVSPDGKLDVMNTISGLTTGLRLYGVHSPGVYAGGVIDSYDDDGTVRQLMLQLNGGNVGIGTTGPAAQLQVGNGYSGGDIRLQGSSASHGTYGTLACGGDNCYFDNSYTAGIELFIQYNGYVGIGTMGPTEKLHIGAGHGKVDVGYQWLTTSDQRLKKNITTLEGTLEKVAAIRGVRYDVKDDSAPLLGQGKYIGVIAQEVEEQFPELVVTDSDGFKSVAYDKLSAIAIQAIKELKAENEALKKRIEIMEAK